MRRQPVVGQAIPGRERQYLALGRKEVQPVLQPLQPLAIACDVQNVLAAGGTCDLGERQRVATFGKAGDGPFSCFALQDGKALAQRCH